MKKENKTNQKFVIFLDIDGVLNSRTTVKQTPMGYRGIDEARVKMLADAISKYGGCEIVLSSNWKELRPDEEHPEIEEFVIFASGTPAVETMSFLECLKSC